MRSAEEERDTVKQDLEGSNLGKDEVIKKAWETRDTAVKRKNASEVELARERIAVMQVQYRYGIYIEGQVDVKPSQILLRGGARNHHHYQKVEKWTNAKLRSCCADLNNMRPAPLRFRHWEKR